MFDKEKVYYSALLEGEEGYRNLYRTERKDGIAFIRDNRLPSKEARRGYRLGCCGDCFLRDVKAMQDDMMFFTMLKVPKNDII